MTIGVVRCNIPAVISYPDPLTGYLCSHDQLSPSYITQVIVGFSSDCHQCIIDSYDLGSIFTISMETCVAGHLLSDADLCPD